jgi:hypothetical protein
MNIQTPAKLVFLVLLAAAGACTQERGASMNDVLNLSIYIDCPPTEVYEFASDPRHLPLWAAGLARSKVTRDGDDWVVEAPFGKAKVKFAPNNPFGVLDHDVQLDSGVTVHNPMRVVPHGEGSEFLFTLIRQPGMSDDKFKQDKEAVQKDLKTLKGLLERDSKGSYPVRRLK